MTPYEVGILLHYYAHVNDPEHYCIGNDLWRDTISRFIDEGLMERRTDGLRSYSLTPRGYCYVSEGLCKVPLPTWTIRFQ